MATTTHNHPRWSAMHYNALAKEIRQMYEEVGGQADGSDELLLEMAARRTLEELALRLARRFKQDRDESTAPHYEFDPIRFLDACSPDVDLYPLSELWEE